VTADQWRELRRVLIRALLMIVRYLQKQEEAERAA